MLKSKLKIIRKKLLSKNLDIKEVTVLKHQLHLVEIHDFFEYSLNKQLYNYIMNMYKKGDDLDTILNTFLYIDNFSSFSWKIEPCY